MDAVGIGKLDPRFGNMVLEQFGGANGELAARRISKIAEQFLPRQF
jgi:Mn-containing catalase